MRWLQHPHQMRRIALSQWYALGESFDKSVRGGHAEWRVESEGLRARILFLARARMVASSWLVAPTWSAQSAGLSYDARALGVQVDAIEIDE